MLAGIVVAKVLRPKKRKQVCFWGIFWSEDPGTPQKYIRYFWRRTAFHCWIIGKRQLSWK
jgi:hypothetical protein